MTTSQDFTAADSGDPVAMHNFGLLCEQREQLAEAEHWYRRAAEAGHSYAAHKVGLLLFERGEFAEAEGWVRQAAEGGHACAMFDLGQLLEERELLAEAESWYRRAAEADHAGGRQALVRLLRQREEHAKAQSWSHRQGIDEDHPYVLFDLRAVLEGGRGRPRRPNSDTHPSRSTAACAGGPGMNARSDEERWHTAPFQARPVRSRL